MTERRAKLYDRARADGWHVDVRCICPNPSPAIVGGDGYWLPPLMCLGCRCILGRNQAAVDARQYGIRVESA